jgi:poly-gamma-glutamate synthesis protein (capsule biosynthesis protein)
MALALGVSLLSARGWTQVVERPAPSLATHVEDDFTLAAVGDLLSPTVVPISARNLDLVRRLRSADVTLGNFEAPAVDLRQRGLEPIGNGTAWPLVAVPVELPRFLKDWGFDMVGFANNHTLDWGPQAARDTVHRLDAAGIVSAGFGETRAGARAPGFFPTSKGRVALVAFTTSFVESTAAMDPLGTTPGVPGVSAVHTTPVDIVTRSQFAVLREIEAQHNTSGGRFGPRPGGDELLYRGRRFRVGDGPDTVYQINAADETDLLRNVRQAKQQSDFLVVSVHNHEEPGCAKPVQGPEGSAWPCLAPPDFLQTLARAAIDNGADAIVGHGPHVLQGIEIYHGRPIFYSLGDLFSPFEQVDLLPDAAPAGFDPRAQTIPEFWEMWWSYYAQDPAVYRSVIAVSRYRGNQLAQIRLYPVDLGQRRRQADRGFPETPSGAEALTILHWMQRLSEPLGTKISIEGNVGVIRIPTAEHAQ